MGQFEENIKWLRVSRLHDVAKIGKMMLGGLKFENHCPESSFAYLKIHI